MAEQPISMTDLASLFDRPTTRTPEPSKKVISDGEPVDEPGRESVDHDHLPPAEPEAVVQAVRPEPAPAPAVPEAAPEPAVAAPAPEPVAAAPKPDPEPPSISSLLDRLAKLSPEQRANLEQLERMGQVTDPTRAETFGKVFPKHAATADGLLPERVEVYGKQFVLGSELQQQRLTPDLLKGPIKRLRSARKRLDSALVAIERSEEDMQKRLQRATMSVLRKSGMARKQHDMELTAAVRALKLFPEGTESHRLVLGNPSAIILRVEPGVTVTKRVDSTAPRGDLPDTDVMATVTAVFQAFIDHKNSLQIATYASKVMRTSYADLYFNIDHWIYYARVTHNNNERISYVIKPTPKLSTHPQPVTPPEPDEVVAQCSIEYRINCRRGEILDFVESLTLMEDLPLYRDLVVAELIDDELTL